MTVGDPYITVIMPVYNAGRYLHEAIGSILNQTFTDFEFLIFNDCSTDNSREIILSFKDDRIKWFDGTVNTGYVMRLNEGLKKAKGKYIARMDADDVALPDRFQKQVTYLDAHPQVVVCGSFISFIGEKKEVLSYPVTHRDIYTHLLIQGNAMAHPAVMMKKEMLVKNQITYNPELEPAEDYDLWNKLARVGDLYNIPEVLLQYRIHDANESVVKKNKQDEKVVQIRTEMISKWEAIHVSTVLDFLRGTPPDSVGHKELLIIRNFVVKIIASGYFNKEYIMFYLSPKFIMWCKKSNLSRSKKVIHYLLFHQRSISLRTVWYLLSTK